MEENGPYTLELVEGDRPLVISNAEGRTVFALEQRDRKHAEEIVANLNSGHAWEEPELPAEPETVLLVGGPYDGDRVDLPEPAANISSLALDAPSSAGVVAYAIRGDGTATFVTESLEDSDDLVDVA